MKSVNQFWRNYHRALKRWDDERIKVGFSVEGSDVIAFSNLSQEDKEIIMKVFGADDSRINKSGLSRSNK